MSNIENHAHRSRKTTRREDIDKVTSIRRNWFLTTKTRICAKKSSKTTEVCACMVTSPRRWFSVNCLHKHVRLNWITTHSRCILDYIGIKLFSYIYGTSLDDRSGSRMTSITSWALNVHCLRNVIKFLWSWLRGSFRAC